MSTEALVFNPSDPAYVADPYPTYRRLRILLERHPGLALAGPITFRPHPFLRQIRSLPLWLRTDGGS